MAHGNRPLILRLLLLIVMLSIILTILVMSDPPVRNVPPWRTFHQVALLEEGYADVVYERFREKGIMVLQQHTATVEIEDFRGRQRVAVAHLDSYFETDDPRLDPFLQGIHTLFSGYVGGEAREIVYIPVAELSTAALLRELNDIPHILVGATSEVAAFAIPAVIFVFFAAMLLTRPRRWLAMGAIVPLVAYTVVAGPVGAIRGAVTTILWLLFLTARSASELEQVVYRRATPFKPVELRYFVLFLVAVTVGTATFIWLPPGDRITGLFVWSLFLVALVVLARIIVLVTAMRLRYNEHRLFVPRYITRQETQVLSHQKEVFLFLLIAVGTVPSLFMVSPTPADARVPAPQEYGAPWDDAGMLLADLQQISLERHPVSSAGYVAHRRFQDTLFFGGAFEIPQRDEAVAITRFTRDDGRIEAFEELMFRLDDPWLTSVFVPDETSVYSLFSLEEGVFVVYPREVTEAVLSPGERNTAIVFLLLVGMVAALYRLPRSRNIQFIRALDKGSDQI